MAYTKTNWAAGDTVTSAKLNKIENQLESLSNGGSGGCLKVNVLGDFNDGGSEEVTKLRTTSTTDSSVAYLDKTYNEIVNAIENGSFVYISSLRDSAYHIFTLGYCGEYNAMYIVTFYNENMGNVSFYSDTPTGVLTDDFSSIEVEAAK